MTQEEKNKIIVGKSVEVALFKTADIDCEELIFEMVRVRVIKLANYDLAADYWAKDQYSKFIQLCIGKDQAWMDRLHPDSEGELLDACKDVNKNGFFKKLATIAAEKQKYLDGMSWETFQKLEAIGRRATQKESQQQQ